MGWGGVISARALLAAACLALLGASGGAEEAIPFDDDRWSIKSGRVEEHLGRTTLAGDADLMGVRLSDGVIDVDLFATGARCFPGIVFRSQDENNAETVYLRPHKPNAADALQYTPIWNGLGSWQLYSGRGYTAAVDVPRDRWFHVRLEVLGDRARVFIDDATDPALVVTSLKRGPEAGGVGLRAPADGAARFSGFRLSEAHGLDFGPTPIVAPIGGAIGSWQLSQPLPITQIDRERFPAEETLQGIRWREVTADPSGLVDIGRHVVRTPGAPQVVLARAVVDAQEEGVRRLGFGYSDEASVFVNGELLFRGDSAFRSRDPGFAGIVGFHDAVFPRLVKGRNEVLLMVSETMGGWGFVTRLEPASGEAIALHPSVRQVWGVAQGLQRPESAAYDSERGVLFVSNVAGSGGEQARDGFISRLTLTGEMKDLRWAAGLHQPTGIAVREGRVFVVEREGVAVFDADTAELATRYPCHTDGFLNDLAIAPEGTLYVSDSLKNRLYRIEDGTCQEWMSGWPLVAPNGVLVDGDTLLVGNMQAGNLLFVDRKTRDIRSVIELEPGGVDGLAHDGHGGYLVSHYQGRILQVQTSGQVEVLVDSRPAGRFCADFEYVVEKGLFVVPDLRGNGLYAYQRHP